MHSSGPVVPEVKLLKPVITLPFISEKGVSSYKVLVKKEFLKTSNVLEFEP